MGEGLKFVWTKLSERDWWRVPMLVFVVLGGLCSTFHVSFQNPAFTLPQYPVAWLFFGLALTVGVVAYAAHRIASRPTTPMQPVDPMHEMLFGAAPLVGIAPEAKKLRIRISGEGEGMIFYKNGKAGDVRVWLDVVNFQDTAVRIDKLVGQIQVNNATVAKFSHHERETIPPFSAALVYISTDLSPEQVDQVAFQRKQGRSMSTGLNLTAYIMDANPAPELRCTMSTGNCRFPNYDLPV